MARKYTPKSKAKRYKRKGKVAKKPASSKQPTAAAFKSFCKAIEDSYAQEVKE